MEQVKIKSKEFKDRDCCGNHLLYRISDWKRGYWCCNDCLLNHLLNEKFYKIHGLWGRKKALNFIKKNKEKK